MADATILPPDIELHLEQSAIIAQRRTMLKTLAGTSPTLGALMELIQKATPEISKVLQSITLDEIRATASMVSLPTEAVTPGRTLSKGEATSMLRQKVSDQETFTISDVSQALGYKVSQSRYLVQQLLKDDTIHEVESNKREKHYSFAE